MKLNRANLAMGLVMMFIGIAIIYLASGFGMAAVGAIIVLASTPFLVKAEVKE